jgi:hypothetical protein
MNGMLWFLCRTLAVAYWLQIYFIHLYKDIIKKFLEFTEPKGSLKYSQEQSLQCFTPTGLIRVLVPVSPSPSFYICTIFSKEPGECSWYSNWLRAGRLRGQSSSPSRVSNFLFTSSKLALGSIQPPIQWVPGTPSPGVKRSGHEAAKVRKKVDLYIHSPICIHDVVLN